jgi:hypothetical protein
MKRNDIVILLKHGHERELWCVLTCGSKTFDLIAYSGYVERHRHGEQSTRPATTADFNSDEEHQTTQLRKEAATARKERRTEARVKRGQIWPSH